MTNNSRIAVTGASGSIGTQLVERLAESPATETILGLDIRRPTAFGNNIFSHRHSVTDSVEHLLRHYGITTVVHLAFQLKPNRDRSAARATNVGGTAQILKDCIAAKIQHLIYLSSTTVYGTNKDDASLFTEDDPLNPVQGFQYAEDKAETERLLSCHDSGEPSFPITTLRSCIVMGPHSANFITSALAKPALIGIRGYDPPMQFLHEKDLLSVICKFIKEPRKGTYNVAGSGNIPYSELARLAGRPLIWLPAMAAYALTQTSWSLRLQSDSPAIGLDLIRWPWLANTDKLAREFGFHGASTSREAILDSRLPR